MNVSKYTQMATLMSSLAYGMLNGEDFGVYDTRVHNGVSKDTHPWDHISLSKNERRGKTYDELQKIRKQRWEESRTLTKED